MTASQKAAAAKAHARKVKEFLRKQAQARAAALAKAAKAKAKSASQRAASTAKNAAQTHGIPSMPKTNMIPV